MLLRRWAPLAGTLDLRVAGRTVAGERETGPAGWTGWYRFADDALVHGASYEMEVDGEPTPDPLARWLPDGVHGTARVYDPATVASADPDWPGRALDATAVIYELHVGTFTEAGTLDAAADRLPTLAELGITHVELMPLAAFDGPYGWGYDGVALDAVHEPYGGPAALRRFVGRAHGLGLAVLLDVVHNHLGPSGNYWGRFGPLFTDRHHTPWGEAVNLDGPGSDDVRALLIGSAVGWLADFSLDGLRLDATHELRDERAVPFLEELAAAVQRLSAASGRPLTLIAESDRNDPRTVTPASAGGLGMTAQWDDDVHHSLHWLLTGEADGYYADFASAAAVRTALEGAFLHAGTYSSFRGRRHGRPVDWSVTPPERFVVSLQTHDQVGNRAAGERLSQLVPLDRLAAGAALLLALPYIPMLFMGEEWGASTPWCFFSSFADPELADAVTAGRRREFRRDDGTDDVPDPQDPRTFARSTLRQDERESAPHLTLWRWYQALIAWRRSLPSDEPAVCASGGPDDRPWWWAVRSGPRCVVANLSDRWVELALEPTPTPSGLPDGEPGVALSWPTAVAVLDEHQLVLPPGATAVLCGLTVVSGSPVPDPAGQRAGGAPSP